MGIHFQTPIVVEPYQFTWFDVTLPDPGPYEAVFRNKACLVCGSDLHVYKGLHPFAPLPACCGHEVAAEVVSVGSKVSSINVGDRVYVAGTGATPIPCGHCYNCTIGKTRRCRNPHIPTQFMVNGKKVARFPSGFGEYTMGHESQAYRLPEEVSFAEAAVTTDAAYVLGVVKRSPMQIGDAIAILGAGPIGLRTLAIAKAGGAARTIVSDPVAYRLRCAQALGADEIVNPAEENPVEKILELTDGEGVKVVYDTTGNSVATQQGLEILTTTRGGRGTLCLMGLYETPHLTFNVSKLMYKAGRIVAEWGIAANGRQHIQEALDLIRHKRLNVTKWISHQLPEQKADEALLMLINKANNAIGVEIIH
jgi:threonine dehydrogenase-like Zn-dependent dehydrogenase